MNCLEHIYLVLLHLSSYTICTFCTQIVFEHVLLLLKIFNGHEHRSNRSGGNSKRMKPSHYDPNNNTMHLRDILVEKIIVST